VRLATSGPTTRSAKWLLAGVITRALGAFDQSNNFSTGSPGRLELARTWLGNCRNLHSLCNKAREGLTLLPSRVIHVGTQNSHDEPYLHESRGEIGSYLALSHRWGGSNVLTTTLRSIEDRKRKIRLETLPKTMRDAILVTRALGFQYLWIDSLCVVQDHLGDWALEAEKMGDIYMNAVITISSVLATDADSGCFVNYDPRKNLPCRLGSSVSQSRQSVDDTKETVWYVSHVHKPEKRDRSSNRPRGPLDTRGWVLQEEVLSLRMLSFCDDGIYWDCLENEASESDPVGMGKTDILNVYPRSRFAKIYKTSLLSSKDTSSHDSLISLKEAWKSVVKDYTARDLTHDSDTLLAVQGLAKYVQQATGWQYYFGLWSHDIHEQLCWHVERRFKNAEWQTPEDRLLQDLRGQGTLEPRPPKPHLRNITTPSWTWAKLKHVIVWEEEHFDHVPSLLENIQLVSDGPSGAEHARILARGLVIPARAIYGDEKNL
jgi:hypothetical protein